MSDLIDHLEVESGPGPNGRQLPKMPGQSIGLVDLTEMAQNGGIPRILTRKDMPHRKIVDNIARVLHRRHGNNVLLTGLRGVGKTAAVWDFARRATNGEIPFTLAKRFLWTDCRQVPPEASRGLLATLLNHLNDRHDLVLCLDGIGSLMRSNFGADNKLMLSSALNGSSTQFIGVLSNRDYEDLISGDCEMLDLFSRVAVDEPDEAVATQILRHVATGLESEFTVQIDDDAILDRFLHHAEVIPISGRSYRLRNQPRDNTPPTPTDDNATSKPAIPPTGSAPSNKRKKNTPPAEETCTL